MAWAEAECKCATCGDKFFFRKRCRNSTDAENFEKWAADHIDECRECQEKRVAEIPYKMKLFRSDREHEYKRQREGIKSERI